jgi:hypothetical protein
MIAFEVFIDGKRLACAGTKAGGVLSFILTSVKQDEARLHLGALVKEDDGVSYHLRWNPAETYLPIGSRVELRIVNGDNIDAPVIRYRSDREIQESPFTEAELRKMRHRQFLELKREFEPNS